MNRMNWSCLTLEQKREFLRNYRMFYAKKYEEYLESGISYKNLYRLMDYDWILCHHKYFIERYVLTDKRREYREAEEIKNNTILNLETNMISQRDASQKMQALRLARKNFNKRVKEEEEKAFEEFKKDND